MDPPRGTGSVTRTFSLSKHRILWLFYQRLTLFNVCTEIILADDSTLCALKLRKSIWYWWFCAMDGGSLWASVEHRGWKQHLKRPVCYWFLRDSSTSTAALSGFYLAWGWFRMHERSSSPTGRHCHIKEISGWGYQLFAQFASPVQPQRPAQKRDGVVASFCLSRN